MNDNDENIINLPNNSVYAIYGNGNELSNANLPEQTKNLNSQTNNPRVPLLGDKKHAITSKRLLAMKEKIELKKDVEKSNVEGIVVPMKRLKTDANISFSNKDSCSTKDCSDIDTNNNVKSCEIFSTDSNLKPNPISKNKTNSESKLPSKKFIYGNYNRYYGYRNSSKEQDDRLSLMKEEWFKDKSVLDVGCNIGHITLSIAKKFSPKTIIGMDIDRELVLIAKKNVRHYTRENMKLNTYKIDIESTDIENGDNKDSDGDTACKHSHDSYIHSIRNNDDGKSLLMFKSVFFIHGNYVPEDDSSIERESEEYDVILALSISKWIHLNFGDEGLKRSFKKMFKQLRSGGLLILEPQEWSSYRKKKKLTDNIFKNFQAIKFKPDQFLNYLVSDEIGFVMNKVLHPSRAQSKGFQRPIWILQKV